MFTEFERVVLDHAEREEQEEFPLVRARECQSTLVGIGAVLRAAEKAAPTHPHPSTAGSPIAQWMVGPWASAIDRAGTRSRPPCREADVIGKMPPGSFGKSRARTGRCYALRPVRALADDRGARHCTLGQAG
jgi:hypothetical protein